MPAEVTVATLIGFRGASTGLDLDVLAGSAGLDRRITLPYIQKTGLALAGFDEYLRPGRVLIFGESEIRFLDAMDSRARVEALFEDIRKNADPEVYAAARGVLDGRHAWLEQGIIEAPEAADAPVADAKGAAGA